MAKRRGYKGKKAPRKARIAKKMARGAGKRRANMAMRRLIQSEIAREIENKDTQYYNLTKSLVGVASPTFQDNIIQLGPNNNGSESMVIQQGVGVNSRVGNKIKTKYLMMKGSIVPLPYQAVTNLGPAPVMVRMVIMYDRTNPTQEPQPATNMFQQSGANTGFFNDLTDLWRPYNTDRYRILTTRTFKLGYASNAGTGAQPGFQNLANNDFKMVANFKINLTKYYPKHVKFDENATEPTTRGLWCLFYYVAASGNPIPADQAMVNVQWMVNYQYEDA